jgi:starch synthase
LRILFAAAEASPFAKVGGLADVAGSLPAALMALGHDVRLVLPAYPAAEGLEKRFVSGVQTPDAGFGLLEAQLANGTPLWLLENHDLFSRPRIYGYDDDARRYLRFGQACLAACDAAGWIPDIVHANDWHTAVLPRLTNQRREQAGWEGAASVLTLHNLAFQGWLSLDDLAAAGLPPSGNRPGGVNVLEDGIQQAQALNAVSPTYAREILTEDLGFGLQDALAARGEALWGILNGIDYSVFDPASDPAIPARFTADDMAGKRACRKALLEESGLEAGAEGIPLVAMVTRLTEQKGIDLVVGALPALLDADQVRVVILGTGEADYEAALQHLAGRYPGRLAVTIAFDAGFSQRIYAGADMFLMPSRFEPCGIGQLIAMRYGTVPVVRRVGGLNDTVHDELTGFVFDDYEVTALSAALARACTVFADYPRWQLLQRAAMAQDNSWDASAQRYGELYQFAHNRVG